MQMKQPTRTNWVWRSYSSICTAGCATRPCRSYRIRTARGALADPVVSCMGGPARSDPESTGISPGLSGITRDGGRLAPAACDRLFKGEGQAPAKLPPPFLTHTGRITSPKAWEGSHR
ncbi:hypothetical protein DPEC_G00349780 [Dallia pectoralis]|uniref:Uncharacterized protein n=1 Tax=Dallia pectoralis TaxID=75939 RepID=A0ACC2F1W8_DALPE|nr:hypothetical protein DPEC_G00349780 [Dallia pectoralis]